jgi:hypothetical protein
MQRCNDFMVQLERMLIGFGKANSIGNTKNEEIAIMLMILKSFVSVQLASIARTLNKPRDLLLSQMVEEIKYQYALFDELEAKPQ